MISLSVKHPDAMDFIKVKRDQTKITGANISLMTDDPKFMELVDKYLTSNEDSTYVQVFPTSIKVSAIYEDIESFRKENSFLEDGVLYEYRESYLKFWKISELWNEFVKSNWMCADPGIIFKDWQDLYSPSHIYPGYKNVCTNPCLSGSTLIITDKGYKAIKDIKVGDKVYSFNGQISDFKSVIYSGKTRENAEINRVTTIRGRFIDCTPDHKFYNVITGNYEDAKDGMIIKVASPGRDKITGSSEFMKYYNERRTGINPPKSQIDERNKWIKENKEEVKQLIDSYLAQDLNNGSIASRLGISHNKIGSLLSDLGLPIDYITKNRKGIRARYSNNLGLIKSIYSRLTGLKAPGNNSYDQGHAILIKYKDQYYYARSTPEFVVLRDLLLSDNLAEIEPKVDGGFRGYHADFLTKDGKYIEVKSYYNCTEQIDERFYLIVPPQIKVSGNFYDMDKDEYHWIDMIESVERKGSEDVYDISVEDNHNFITISGGVHNCGEIMMSGEDSCRLIATNVIPFVSHPFEKDANLNYNQWQFSCFISAVIGDCLVDLEAEHVQRIIDKVKSEEYSIPGVKEIIVSTWTKLKENGLNGRRVGCGLTGIADAEAMLGLKYGDPNFTEKLMQYKFLGEWYASIALAECYGPFNGWDWEIDDNSEFFNRALDRIITIQGREEVGFFIGILNKYGRRNISISTCAPNGTTSLLAGGISSGIEPVFKVESIRSVKVMNDNEEYDYVDPVGCKFKNYTVYHSGYQKWLSTPGELKMCKENPYKGCEAEDLNYHDRIKHQAIIQIYVSHSISSTVNLSKDTTPEIMGSIYHEAWKNKLKGITLYKSGSKSGIIKSKEDDERLKKDESKSKPFVRPQTLNCKIIKLKMKLPEGGYEDWMVYMSIYEGKPVEVFTGRAASSFKLPDYVTDGEIIKSTVSEGKRRYDFRYKDSDGYNVTIEGLSRCFNPEFYNYSKMTSSMLQNGVPVDRVVRILERLNLDDNINSWKSVVTRALRKYIKSGTQTGDVCPECGKPLVYSEGCVHCPNCGFSKCS